MSLKALTDMVLKRDSTGTNSGTISYNLSQKAYFKYERSGTVIQFPLTDEQREIWEERSVIMENNLSYKEIKRSKKRSKI